MNHVTAPRHASTDVSALCTIGYRQLNPIPLNPTPGSKWTASRRDDEREFVRRLEAKGISTTVRDTRGSDIDGACGQLAAAE